MRAAFTRLFLAVDALGTRLAARSPFLWWIVFALLLGACIGWAMLFVHIIRAGMP